jgi:GYF domain 2
MTQSNNDIEELEELLTELEGQEAQLVRPYSEDDDAVTQLMDAPLGDQEWMVQVTALDRRMMSTDQVLSELRAGKLSNRTLVWRGGMDDWLPIARVDSLAQGSLPAPGATGRLAAPAPLPAPPPMWSTLPSAAPLAPSAPPPSAPVALPSSPLGVVGLPPPASAPAPSSQTGLSRPVSALPLPSLASSQGNTARPVALDFSDMAEDNTSPLRGKRTLMALSAVAILAAFLSVYALSSKSDGTASAESPSAEQPRAVSALQPAASEKAGPTPAASGRPAEPALAAAATSKPSESELADREASASNGSSARTTAPARYSPRSEYRRRSRGSSTADRAEESESSAEAPATEVPASAATPARATAAAAEEEAPTSEPSPVAAADDDADSAEAPKSTGRANTFNRQAAKAALDEAAGQAKNCRPAGGPSGTGRVQVSYEPSGKVAGVTILTSKFENTTTGSCVRMLFRRAKVPEFTGVPVMVVSKAFEIP